MPVYKDQDASYTDRVEDLLQQMTLDEKLAQIVGDSATGFDTPVNDRLGIPGFKMTDGPIGVRWYRATAFPSAVSLAATWDTALTQRYAEALAKETLAKGRNLLLGPCVNIHRFPAGGRNFESYGEDPYLTSRLAVNYIKTLQGNGVIASVKHYALNNQEWRRTEVDVKVDERTMREIYLPSFEGAVKEAGVYTVMSSYNKVNGWWASENDRLLNQILKDEWGFRGLVVSDWVSTHNTVNAANHGLDLEMPFAQVFTKKS
jgi:beta-glucosidase